MPKPFVTCGPKVKCGKCGTVIQSMYRHDYVGCACKAIAIDGGNSYTRLVFDIPENVRKEDGSPFFNEGK